MLIGALGATPSKTEKVAQDDITKKNKEICPEGWIAKNSKPLKTTLKPPGNRWRSQL